MPASGSDYPARDRAVCAVGAENPVTWPGRAVKARPFNGGDRAVAFGELLCFDHVWHARSGRLAALLSR